MSISSGFDSDKTEKTEKGPRCCAQLSPPHSSNSVKKADTAAEDSAWPPSGAKDHNWRRWERPADWSHPRRRPYPLHARPLRRHRRQCGCSSSHFTRRSRHVQHPVKVLVRGLGTLALDRLGIAKNLEKGEKALRAILRSPRVGNHRRHCPRCAELGRQIGLQDS